MSNQEERRRKEGWMGKEGRGIELDGSAKVVAEEVKGSREE